MILKYIIFEKDYTTIIFPKFPFSHKEIAANLGIVFSAGFCILKTADNRISVTCYGSSSSLNIGSKPETDKIILENMINSDIRWKSLVNQV